jgi:flagella basal body P-ring formation protein FlgA
MSSPTVRRCSRPLCWPVLPLIALALRCVLCPAGVASAAPKVVSLHLPAELTLDAQGLRLPELAPTNATEALPPWVLHASPGIGTPVLLSRSNLQQILSRPEFSLAVTQWTGAESIRLLRRTRTCADRDIQTLVAAALSANLEPSTELELQLARPWTPLAVPDDVLSVRVLGLPGTGIAPLFNARVELLAGSEVVGTWQIGFQARLWREVWVSRGSLRRGQTVTEADFVRERRDILALRDSLAEFGETTHAIELSEAVQAGAPVLQRHLRLRTVIRRGQNADAIFQDGALNLTLKVEALEDGAPGQVIRIRNPASRRELRGKVQNERTVVVTL